MSKAELYYGSTPEQRASPIKPVKQFYFDSDGKNDENKETERSTNISKTSKHHDEQRQTIAAEPAAMPMDTKRQGSVLKQEQQVLQVSPAVIVRRLDCESSDKH
eukprot:4591327-Pleurochrysis_carterae.AAC.3